MTDDYLDLLGEVEPADDLKPRDITDLLPFLTPAERSELDGILDMDVRDVAWRPQPGPQTTAWYSQADVIGFGGAAGGGKTDLACGLAVVGDHEVSAIFRRNGSEMTAILDRLEALFGSRDGFNGKDNIWRRDDRQVELCSIPNLGDEKKYQGRPKDLLVLDEAANMLEKQVRFLMGWVRSAKGIKSQTLMTFNPPTDSDGRWIVKFFGPWIDRHFKGKRALPGELRIVAMIPDAALGTSKDVWLDDPRPFVMKGEELCYDFDPKEYRAEDIITPQTRTFIPSRVSDNSYLIGTGYLSQLQAMPEPARSQMLYGDFEAGMQDSIWQVIPTRWIEAAQARWTDRSPKGEMSNMGVDVARGGQDSTALAPRHGKWYDRLKRIPGRDTPDGPSVMGHVVAGLRDDSPVSIDVIGVGSSPYDFLNSARFQVVGVNVGEKATGHGRSGRLSFFNLRTQLWWDLREDLDPANDTGIMLPPDEGLLTELCAPQWRMDGKNIRMESREEIIDRIGTSPDAATAVVLARMDVPKAARLDPLADAVRKSKGANPLSGYDPHDNLTH